jgi:hypothetical protein
LAIRQCVHLIASMSCSGRRIVSNEQILVRHPRFIASSEQLVAFES